MPITHLGLALLVILIWGINFLFVSISLKEVSPLLLCAIRFTLASIPAIFFIKKPAIPFQTLAAYGLVMFALQFTFGFFGMNSGMTPGMASIILQVQVFFSIFFAMFFLKETPATRQIVGAFVSFAGICVIATHFDAHLSFQGFILIIASAAAWGLGNLITKKIKNVNMMSLVVWGTFIAAFPMLGLSFFLEGPSHIIYTFYHLSWLSIIAIAYITYLSTWVGYGTWNWLLHRYPMSSIAPFALLVPIVAMLGSILILHEPFYLWKLLAGTLVIGGLCINLLGDRLFTPKLQPEKVNP